MNTFMRILLAEDNFGDVLLVREALAALGAAHDLQVAPDGLEALYRVSPEALADEGRPDLIILDLNMPQMNGREVLEHLAGRADLREVPVAVLTTSSSESSICRDFPDLRILFSVKPSGFRELVATMRRIVDFGAADRSAVS